MHERAVYNLEQQGGTELGCSEFVLERYFVGGSGVLLVLLSVCVLFVGVMNYLVLLLLVLLLLCRVCLGSGALCIMQCLGFWLLVFPFVRSRKSKPCKVSKPRKPSDPSKPSQPSKPERAKASHASQVRQATQTSQARPTSQEVEQAKQAK